MSTDINELWIGYLLLSEQFHYIQHFILFQYISCYSLSNHKKGKNTWLYWFQYISCYSLSAYNGVVPSVINSFNTSHVTLYPYQMSRAISGCRCFNTSHVTLYLEALKAMNDSPMFQYISCYSLSVFSY